MATHWVRTTPSATGRRRREQHLRRLFSYITAFRCGFHCADGAVLSAGRSPATAKATSSFTVFPPSFTVFPPSFTAAFHRRCSPPLTAFQRLSPPPFNAAAHRRSPPLTAFHRRLSTPPFTAVHRLGTVAITEGSRTRTVASTRTTPTTSPPGRAAARLSRRCRRRGCESFL